jgi:hypothetical protein
VSTVPLRKASAGADSFGHEWPEDGAVVEVDYDHAMALLAIPDGGFSVADQKDEPEIAEPDPGPEMSEVEPEPDESATDTPPKKTTRGRSTAK